MDAQGRISKAYIDTTNDGTIDRAQIYTRDPNGNVIKTENDIGNDGSINSSVSYEYNALGYITKQYNDSDNDGNANNIISYQRDMYGNATAVENDTNADGIVNSTTHQKFDSQGRLSYQWNDVNNNGVKDSPDSEGRLYEYDVFGNVVHSQGFSYSNGQTTDIYNTYNVKKQLVERKFDHNSTASPGINETYTYEYEPVFNARSVEKYIKADNSVGIITNYEVDDLGSYNLALRDRFNKATNKDLSTDGLIDEVAFGPDINTGGAYSSTVDLTTWVNNPSRTNVINQSLKYLALSNPQATTELTLDKAALKAFADKSLVINGDATDTITFKDISKSDFVAGSQRITNLHNGNQTYDQYKVNIDGETYNLTIDADINLTFGG